MVYTDKCNPLFRLHTPLHSGTHCSCSHLCLFRNSFQWNLKKETTLVTLLYIVSQRATKEVQFSFRSALAHGTFCRAYTHHCQFFFTICSLWNTTVNQLDGWYRCFCKGITTLRYFRLPFMVKDFVTEVATKWLDRNERYPVKLTRSE